MFAEWWYHLGTNRSFGRPIMRRVASLLLMIGFAVVLAAQAPSGEITGVVDDPTGAVVPGVEVTLTNPATNAVRSAITNEAGLYAFRALPPGIYNLRAELA